MIPFFEFEMSLMIWFDRSFAGWGTTAVWVPAIHGPD
jgi:hypothetical protein